LGPGLIGAIFDGIQRPLNVIRDMAGDYIARGLEVPGLDREKKWAFTPVAKAGQKVTAGAVLGTVQETPLVAHRVMVPPTIKEATVKAIHEGEFTVTDTVAELDTPAGTVKVSMLQRWPVRQSRPVKEKLAPVDQLVTGQRVIDAFFPIAKGGTACVPGPFGSGKTGIQHQLAKWANADLLVFIGCGERGNEMTALLWSSRSKDPRSGRPLMERTILVANTSNCRWRRVEASITQGDAAEYTATWVTKWRSMADSTSRGWKPLREIRAALRKCPAKKDIPPTWVPGWAELYEESGRL
jgi:V/A-type H+-transporting ATPase subunit A